MSQLIKRHVVRSLRKRPGLLDRLERLVGDAREEPTIFLEFPLDSHPRYGYGVSPHPKLYEIINRNRNLYKDRLRSFAALNEHFLRIPVSAPESSIEPFWGNAWLPCLDAAALYGFVASEAPKKVFEVGSGNSTKFARRAIRDHDLRTRILSIDPQPRAEIDSLCDEIIRAPLEDVDLSIFDQLESGDILFVDCSHVVYMNSDSTVFFLEILPRLKPGVFVQIHDMFLPYDYPPDWRGRFYAEQYLLAAYLLAEGNKLNIVLPNFFISLDSELGGELSPIWDKLKERTASLNTGGGSFWLQTN
jgi:Methyltransferase domain